MFNGMFNGVFNACSIRVQWCVLQWRVQCVGIEIKECLDRTPRNSEDIYKTKARPFLLLVSRAFLERDMEGGKKK
jgi:hypothetical protein